MAAYRPGTGPLSTPFPAWCEHVYSLLRQTETRYDLAEGEVMQATGTNQTDLRELWGFGCLPNEAARTIVETLGLR
ncbi:MAG: hypothetical protein MK101_08610 [Phycisphaerales bacterium]|nr:hypothetical protein [Phycisphaerales bacterium]